MLRKNLKSAGQKRKRCWTKILKVLDAESVCAGRSTCLSSTKTLKMLRKFFKSAGQKRKKRWTKMKKVPDKYFQTRWTKIVKVLRKFPGSVSTAGARVTRVPVLYPDGFIFGLKPCLIDVLWPPAKAGGKPFFGVLMNSLRL